MVDVARGTALGSGQIYDANRPMLLAAIADAGGEAMDLGITSDTASELERAVDSAIEMGADVLISSGGVSMGDKDFMHDVLAAELDATALELVA